MNISKKTIDLFKIFSRLNLSIMILPDDIEDNGHRIYSKSISGSSMCTAVIDEKIDKPFITTDLTRFIKTIELFPSDSDYEFSDSYVTITSPLKNQKFKFYYSPKSLVECTQSNKLPKKQTDIAIEIPFLTRRTALQTTSILKSETMKLMQKTVYSSSRNSTYS